MNIHDLKFEPLQVSPKDSVHIFEARLKEDQSWSHVAKCLRSTTAKDHEQFSEETAILRLYQDAHDGDPLVVPVVAEFKDSLNINGQEYVWCYVMPRCESLREYIDRHRTIHQLGLEESDAVGIGRSIAESLHALHNGETVHRDVKPDNIFFSKERNAWCLADFGIAFRKKFATWATESPAKIGTAGYMPRENYGCKENHFDPRNDVFGLGATLYHMLLGRPPFPRDQATCLSQKEVKSRARHEVKGMIPALPVRKVRPELSVYVEYIVAKCLEHDLTKRFQSCEDVANELQGIQQRLAEQERLADEQREQLKLRKKRLKLTLAMGSVLTLIVIAIVVSVTQRSDPPPETVTRSSLPLSANITKPPFDLETLTQTKLRFVVNHLDSQKPLESFSWRIREPHDGHFEDGGSHVIGKDRRIELHNRGSISSASEFKEGVVLQVLWMWVEGQGTYSDELTIAIRSDGIHDQKWPHEITNGIAIKLRAHMGKEGDLIVMQYSDDSPDQYLVMPVGLPLQKFTWRYVTVCDVKGSVRVYFGNDPVPVASFPLPDSIQHHRIAIYNREAVAAVIKSSLIDDVRIAVPIN